MTDSTLHTDYNNLVNGVRAVKSSVNPHFKNRFAPLDVWLDELHRLTVLHNFIFTECIEVRTCGEDVYQVHIARLKHIDGVEFASEYFISLIDKPQQMGSATTYARRYNIQTLLTCTGEDDDDGNEAQSVISVTKVAMKRKLA